VLSQCDDVSEPVRVPQVAGMSDEELYQAFTLLVEFAYTSSAEVHDEQCTGVWALAACLQFTSLQARLGLGWVGGGRWLRKPL